MQRTWAYLVDAWRRAVIPRRTVGPLARESTRGVAESACPARDREPRVDQPGVIAREVADDETPENCARHCACLG